MGGLSWVNVKSKLRLILLGSQTKILILKNEIIIPKKVKRTWIIHENHTTENNYISTIQDFLMKYSNN